jgi:predicted nucleic acid-binding protein
MAVLIDSSVFIALERRGAGPDEVLTLVPDEPVALPAVSASELLFGVERADTPQRRARTAPPLPPSGRGGWGVRAPRRLAFGDRRQSTCG